MPINYLGAKFRESMDGLRAATARGVPAARDQTAAVTLQAKQINVSHIFNEVSRLSP